MPPSDKRPPVNPGVQIISQTKDTNPKDAVGVRKVPFSVIPWGIVARIGLAMLEGARKYGRHNYRVSGVRASIYFDAALRHLSAWWEGEDIDRESGESHVIKAAASLVVLADGMGCADFKDDRPPKLPEGWQAELNDRAGAIIDAHPDPKPPHTEI